MGKGLFSRHITPGAPIKSYLPGEAMVHPSKLEVFLIEPESEESAIVCRICEAYRVHV